MIRHVFTTCWICLQQLGSCFYATYTFFTNYKYYSKFDLLHISKAKSHVVDDLVLRLNELYAFMKLQPKKAQGSYKEFVGALQT